MAESLKSITCKIQDKILRKRVEVDDNHAIRAAGANLLTQGKTSQSQRSFIYSAHARCQPLPPTPTHIYCYENYSITIRILG